MELFSLETNLFCCKFVSLKHIKNEKK